MTTKIYLDTRRPKQDDSCPLKISITQNRKISYVNLNISLLQKEWNKSTLQVINRPDKQIYNTIIHKRKQEVDDILFSLGNKAKTMTANQLKKYVEQELLPEDAKPKDQTKLFVYNFKAFMNHKEGRTKEIYQATLNHLYKYDKSLEKRKMDEINVEYINNFNDYLIPHSPSKNARNIHLRNIRAIFNYAINNEVTTNYPFRRIKITPDEIVHKALSIDELRTLMSAHCPPWQQHYVDMFKLIFFLCGINIIDLYNLKGIVKGRLEYKRAKTHKLYNIKVEPEALEIINKYKGTEHLLDIADRCRDYRHYAMRLNAAVQRIKGFEKVTTYWMRHTWATIAAEINIPYDVISLALGHAQGSGARVTQVYIKPDLKKIDEANRKVMDYVLYDKR